MPTKTEADLLADIRKQMETRLEELRPAAEEYISIQQALNRLNAKTPGRKRKSE